MTPPDPESLRNLARAFRWARATAKPKFTSAEWALTEVVLLVTVSRNLPRAAIPDWVVLSRIGTAKRLEEILARLASQLVLAVDWETRTLGPLHPSVWRAREFDSSMPHWPGPLYNPEPTLAEARAQVAVDNLCTSGQQENLDSFSPAPVKCSNPDHVKQLIHLKNEQSIHFSGETHEAQEAESILSRVKASCSEGEWAQWGGWWITVARNNPDRLERAFSRYHAGVQKLGPWLRAMIHQEKRGLG